MILYLDTSSIVAIHLQERRRFEALATAHAQSDAVASSVLAYPETRAAFARALSGAYRDVSLAREEYQVAVDDFHRSWQAYVHVAVDDTLIRAAGDAAANYAIRGYDAVHLTSALRIRQVTGEEVLFSTWDRALAQAAASAGLALAHEVNA